jgi:O-antigen ligase
LKPKAEPRRTTFPAEGRAIPAIFAALLMIISLAPLPLGAARPLAWDILGLSVGFLLITSFLFSSREFSRVPADLTPCLFAFFAVLCFAALQAVALFPAKFWNPIWQQAAETLGHPVQGSIAVSRQAVFTGIFRLTTYAGVFYLAHCLGRDTKRSRTGIAIISFGGATYAAYGLIAYWTGNSTVLWLDKWAYPDDLTGTFVNRNSFAAFLGIGLLATLCHLVMGMKWPHFADNPRDRIRLWIEFLSAQSWIFLCIFVQATALLLTHSRGGNFATLFGILIFGAALSQSQHLRRTRLVGIIILPILVVFAAFLINGSGVVNRWIGTDIDSDGRFAIYKHVFKIISDYPFWGTGLGSFTTIFPLYRTEDVPTHFVNAAHNDYLENMLELGIPTALVLFLCVAWIITLCVRGIRRRRHGAAIPCLGVAASALVAAHSLVDFSLQIPAITVTYLFVLGIAVAQSRSNS